MSETMTPTRAGDVNYVSVVLVGLAAGALSGLFGVGGGLIIVPGLVGIVGIERRLAHGTSLAATLPIALASVTTYIVNGNVDWAMAGLLAIGTIGGAIIGTHLLQVVSKRALTLAFVVVVLATALRLALSTETTGRVDITITSAIFIVLIGLATGTLAGMLGIGGGIIMVPAMVVFYDMIPVVAKGTSVAVIVPTSITGTIRNRRNDNVDLRIAIVVGLTGVVSAVFGSILADGMSARLSNILFALLLVFVAITQLLTLRSDDH
ncbi:MAG: sulfite exporter TauE/SafE family protein [Acidimicrobiia bacterium]|nr:sulfite exporter TauE/SafE family protein [Acidimicrobiia bacterium]